MTAELSSNAQAILLLAAPLIAGRGKPSVDPLTVGEYRRFARRLRELEREPADLLGPELRPLLNECRFDLDPERIERLLGRGFLLSQAIERWRARAIWVVSRADEAYPQRQKSRLGSHAPPVIYGCGDASLLDRGGLAVVGSRNVDDALVQYTENVGRLAALAHRSVISGGARGIDRAAMRGAQEAGGNVVGVLAYGLEKAAVLREHREALMDGRMVLTCPYDPASRFNVGHAMQRNKLIYALADAALVVNSDCGKGGTWTGAIEQIEKLKLVSVYARADGDVGKGLKELLKRGAKPWSNPKSSEDLEAILDAPQVADDETELEPRAQRTLSVDVGGEPRVFTGDCQAEPTERAEAPESQLPDFRSPADELFANVEELLERMDGPRTGDHISRELEISKSQADGWLKRFVGVKLRDLFRSTSDARTEAELADELRIPKGRIRSCLKHLVEEGVIEKLPRHRPAKYRSIGSIGPLFDRR